MRLDNEFEVPRPVDEAWAVLTDVERIAPCMPGAQLTEVDGDVYHGIVKVKVGPITAQYSGEARFKELDAQRRHAVLEAKGKEKSGRGLASALVTADLEGNGDSTKVRVSTDLTISGPLAQFGRGAIAEVSAKLLGQFADCLRQTVLDSPSATPAAASTAPVTPAPGPAAAGASAAGAPAAAEAAAPGSPASEPAAPTAPAGDDATATTGPAATAGAEQPQPSTGTAQPGARRTIQGPEAQAVNVLAVARGSILKRVIPLVAVIVIVIVLIVWLA
jgi:carbon monoxide dehydrogenase subunit G